MEVEFMMLKQAVDLFWRFKFQEAETILTSFSDTNVAFAFHYAEVAFMKAVITEDKEDAKVADGRINACMKLARKQKKESEKPDTIPSILLAKIIQGEVSLLDAALKFRLQRQLTGVYTFRKSWKYFEAAISYRKKLDDNHPMAKEIDTYLQTSVGFFHFIIGVVPKEFQWLAEGVGFKGNRDLGIEEMKRAISLGGVKAVMSQFHFIWIYSFFFEDFAEGEKYINEILSRIPDAVPALYLAGYVYRKQGKLDDAERVFAAASKNSTEVKQVQRFGDYEQGYCSYLKLDYENAIKTLTRFLNDSPGESFRVYASFQLAMSYELTNQPALAAEQMKKLLPWVRKNYDYDEFAERKAKRYLTLKGGLSAFDKHFHVCMLHYEACRWEETLKAVTEIEPTIHADEDRARLMWLKGAVLQKQNKLNEAKILFQDVVSLEKAVGGKDSSFVIPHSLCGLGEILIAEKQWDAALRTLKKSKSYSGYDFSQLLGWRIKKDIENLKKAKAGKL